MINEYVARKFAKLRWKNSATSPLRPACSTEYHDNNLFICGTFGELDNTLSVWSTNTERLAAANIPLDDNLKLHKTHEVSVGGANITQVVSIDNLIAVDDSSNLDAVVVGLSSGDLALFRLEDLRLELVYRWPKVHSNSTLDCIYHPSLERLISCGEDGILSIVDLRQADQVSRSDCISQHSLECIDIISNNEVICGTSSGHLKLVDLREKKGKKKQKNSSEATSAITMTLANPQSIVTAVRRNLSISHVVSCANDSGLLAFWDLRNGAKQLMQIAAHNALVSEMHYVQSSPNILLTSSYDGQIFRWNVSPSSQLISVDSVLGKHAKSPINSFDISSSDEIIISADNEVLYYGHL